MAITKQGEVRYSLTFRTIQDVIEAVPNSIDECGGEMICDAIQQHLDSPEECCAQIDFLVDAGVDLNKETSKSKTPLHWAIGIPRWDFAVQHLLSLGADPTFAIETDDILLALR